MKRRITIVAVLTLLFFSGLKLQAQEIPNKREFLSYWTTFKNAIKNNDADFLFSNMDFPFQSEGSYYNSEASLEDIKENYKQVLPPYIREMEYVRFDAILVSTGGYIWLGYNEEDDTFFYCLKMQAPGGDTNTPTYEEKYLFHKTDKGFRFFATSLGIE